MKLLLQIAKIIGILAANFLMFIIFLFMYIKSENTFSSKYLIEYNVIDLIYFIILFFGSIICIVCGKKWIKQLGIGLLLIFTSIIGFLIHYTNFKIVKNQHWQSFATNNYDKFSFDYDLNSFGVLVKNKHIFINCNYSNFIPVDSVEVLVNNGFFGIEFLSDSFVIKQKKCDSFKYSNSTISIEELEEDAEYYTLHREFNNAIKAYEKILKLDNKKIFYNKKIADLYLILKQYKKALFYYIRTYNNQFSSLSAEEKMILKSKEKQEIIQDLNNNVNSKINGMVYDKNDSLKINELELLQYIKSEEFKSYQNLESIEGVDERILLCKNKLNL